MADDARILAIWRRKRDILKTAREARVTAGRVGEVVRRNRYRHHREVLAAQARKAATAEQEASRG